MRRGQLDDIEVVNIYLNPASIRAFWSKEIVSSTLTPAKEIAILRNNERKKNANLKKVLQVPHLPNASCPKYCELCNRPPNHSRIDNLAKVSKLVFSLPLVLLLPSNVHDSAVKLADLV